MAKRGGYNASAADPIGGRGNIGNLVNDPKIMAALESQLAGMMGVSSGYIESLPLEVKHRMQALKNLQVRQQQVL